RRIVDLKNLFATHQAIGPGPESTLPQVMRKFRARSTFCACGMALKRLRMPCDMMYCRPVEISVTDPEAKNACFAAFCACCHCSKNVDESELGISEISHGTGTGTKPAEKNPSTP